RSAPAEDRDRSAGAGERRAAGAGGQEGRLEALLLAGGIGGPELGALVAGTPAGAVEQGNIEIARRRRQGRPQRRQQGETAEEHSSHEPDLQGTERIFLV